MSALTNASAKCYRKLTFHPFLSRHRMPVQAPSWTEFLICPICTNEFAANLRAPITLRCGHSICKKCLETIQQCPYDQVSGQRSNQTQLLSVVEMMTCPNIRQQANKTCLESSHFHFPFAVFCLSSLSFFSPSSSEKSFFTKRQRKKREKETSSSTTTAKTKKEKKKSEAQPLVSMFTTDKQTFSSFLIYFLSLSQRFQRFWKICQSTTLYFN